MAEIKVRIVDTYIFIREKSELKFLLLRRSPGKIYADLWQSVTGKIKPGEKAWEASLRELREETGLEAKNIFSADHISTFYEAEFDTINMVPVFGIEVEDQDVVLSDEHSAFTWVNFPEAEKLLSWAGQKKGLKAVAEMASGNDPRINLSEIHQTKE